MKNSRGFTLFELLLALAIAFILFGVAVPAVSSGLEAARSLDARADLLASLSIAANRAAITGAHAVLCPSPNGNNCSDSVDWSLGWIVFLDGDGDGDVDAADSIVQRRAALAGKVRLHSSVGRTRIVFQGNGGNVGSNVTFTLCDGRGAVHARALILSNQGRLRDAAASASNIVSTCPR